MTYIYIYICMYLVHILHRNSYIFFDFTKYLYSSRLVKVLLSIGSVQPIQIRKKNDIIKRLQTDLHQIEKFSDENIRRTRAEAEKQEIADTKNSDQKTQKLQAEINQLQGQLNNAVTEHREIEADLRGVSFMKYKTGWH